MLCTKSFSRMDHLHRHHRELFIIPSPTYECAICKIKKFLRKDHLYKHQQTCPQLKTPIVQLVDLKETDQTEQTIHHEAISDDLFDFLEGTEQFEAADISDEFLDFIEE